MRVCILIVSKTFCFYNNNSEKLFHTHTRNTLTIRIVTVTYPGALVASYTLFSTCSPVPWLSGKQKDPKVSLQLQTTLPIHAVYFWEYLLGIKNGLYKSENQYPKSSHCRLSTTTMQEQYLTLWSSSSSSCDSSRPLPWLVLSLIKSNRQQLQRLQFEFAFQENPRLAAHQLHCH